MYGATEEIVRTMMKERSQATREGAEYRDWCRHECVGAARNG